MDCPLPNLKELHDRVIAVGQLLLEYWPGNPQVQPGTLTIEQKSDGSSVTSADYKANELLQVALRTLYPGDAIISEESPLPEGPRPNSVWIIDPLDGTQSFIDGKDDFSILVAHVSGNVVDRAIMYFPALNISAVAQKGRGAFINGQPARVSTSSSPGNEKIYVRNFDLQHPSFYTKKMDSGRAFLAVATGEFDGAIIRMGRHNEWDLAAPALVIQEAGGRISAENSDWFEFNQGYLQHGWFIASNSAVHANLVDLIAI